MEYLKPVLMSPTIEHELECGSWDSARRLAYAIREGLYAAQFHEGYEHIAHLRTTHMITHSGSCVRLVPKFDESVIKSLQPLPTWARYVGTRKTAITCESATNVVDVLASCRGIQENSPWKEVLFPNVRCMKLTSKQRRVIHETSLALGRRVLDLDDEGISLVLVPKEGDLFLSVYYDPAEEEGET